ncbi:MAG: rRNA maturation RNase YbeY [Candidatus Chisholmbacteria bacterium]|nr:rRNA maturation RNase YbeY [Candidatus Chisholmbacteria bacterium]
MYSVEITGESRFPVDRKRVRAVVARVLKAYGVQGAVVVGVRIVGDRKMRQLNSDFRRVDSTTDVLSFPTEDPSAALRTSPSAAYGGFAYPKEEAFPLGDIVISYPQARLQAAERDILVNDEIEALLEHGVKSLLGEHDE